MLKETIARAAAGLLLAAALSGTALASGKPDNPGKSESAPGQVKQEGQPAQPPAKSEAPADRGKSEVKRAETKAQKAARASSRPAKSKPSGSRSKSYKVTSSGTNERKPEQTHRHTICHATGSESNPYVRITPSVSGVFNGHMGHQDGEDIVPPFVYKGTTYSQNWDAEGQAIFNAGCRPAPEPAPAAVIVQTTTTTTTTTTTVATTEAVAASAKPRSAGGVAGVQATLPAKKSRPAGGVLGAVGRIGRTATESELPFTGLPLWIGALVGLGLLGSGLALRRAL